MAEKMARGVSEPCSRVQGLGFSLGSRVKGLGFRV